MEKKTIYGMYLMAYMMSRAVDLEIKRSENGLIATYENDEYAQQVREDYFTGTEIQEFIKAIKDIKEIRAKIQRGDDTNETGRKVVKD